uniref:Coiled-coil domain-containing protein 86 n=1 Tax=Haemonchus contortus TaxID=6289 RepID=A0A7I5ECT2_HAECO
MPSKPVTAPVGQGALIPLGVMGPSRNLGTRVRQLPSWKRLVCYWLNGEMGAVESDTDQIRNLDMADSAMVATDYQIKNKKEAQHKKTRQKEKTTFKKEKEKRWKQPIGRHKKEVKLERQSYWKKIGDTFQENPEPGCMITGQKEEFASERLWKELLRQRD